MDQRYDVDLGEERKIVYVRPVAVKDLPSELRQQAPAEGFVYAVHDTDGQRLALVGNRELAFILARQNDLAPVHVH